MDRRQFLGSSIAVAGSAALGRNSLAASEAISPQGPVPGAIAAAEIEGARFPHDFL